MVPLGVIFPILLPSSSVNHRLPSGPVVMSLGVLLLVGIGNSVKVTVPCACERLIAPDNGIATAAASMTNAARLRNSFDLRNLFTNVSPHYLKNTHQQNRLRKSRR